MKACLLHSPAPVERNPLEFADAPDPRPGKGEVLVRVKMCGVCRTDLHVVEGELPPTKVPGDSRASNSRRGRRSRRGREPIQTRRSRGHSLAAQHRSDLRILPRRAWKIFATILLSPVTPWTAATRNSRRARGFRLCHSRSICRRARRAAAMRGNHRISFAAPFGNKTRRASRVLRFWSGGARRDSGRAPLGSRSVRMHARSEASAACAATWRRVGGRSRGRASRKTRRRDHFRARRRTCSSGARKPSRKAACWFSAAFT